MGRLCFHNPDDDNYYIRGMIVWVDGYDSSIGEPMVEPLMSLQELDAVLNYIRDQFPDGWEIKDGKVTGCVPLTVPEEEKEFICDHSAECKNTDWCPHRDPHDHVGSCDRTCAVRDGSKCVPVDEYRGFPPIPPLVETLPGVTTMERAKDEAKYICKKANTCRNTTCYHNEPHNHGGAACEGGGCHMSSGEEVSCVPVLRYESEDTGLYVCPDVAHCRNTGPCAHTIPHPHFDGCKSPCYYGRGDGATCDPVLVTSPVAMFNKEGR